VVDDLLDRVDSILEGKLAICQPPLVSVMSKFTAKSVTASGFRIMFQGFY
jgi:hypothetical protein